MQMTMFGNEKDDSERRSHEYGDKKINTQAGDAYVVRVCGGDRMRILLSSL
jgi:hypothetical protein